MSGEIDALQLHDAMLYIHGGLGTIGKKHASFAPIEFQVRLSRPRNVYVT